MKQRVTQQNQVRPRKATTLNVSLELFVLDGKVKRLSRHTLSFCRSHLGRFFGGCEGQGAATVQALTPDMVGAYLVLLQDRGLTDHSVHAAARSLRASFNFCASVENIEASPTAKVKMPRFDKRILPAYSKADVKRLLGACAPNRERAIVLPLLETGLRAAEYDALTVADVDFESGTVRVRGGKGRKDRMFYLGHRAPRAL